MTMGMVSIKNLKKTYGDFTAVNDISFEIRKARSSAF